MKMVMETPKLSDWETHPIAVSFRMISTKFSTHQWEVEIQLSAQILGSKNNNTMVVGRTFVTDTDGSYSPLKAFNIAVKQIMEGDTFWRPILAHDQER